MDVYLVVVHDVELRSREYAVLAHSEEDAKAKVADGQFLTESESTTMDTIETKIVSAEQVGSDHEDRAHRDPTAIQSYEA